MDNNEELYKNLVSLLKLFKNRPYHLAKYLIDNSAFNKTFVNKVLKSEKLNEFSEDKIESINTSVYFVNISQMEDFYNSLLEEMKDISKVKNTEEIATELNARLNELIKNEKYEEAAKIRDYMNKNRIKRNN
jgi:cysteinyl-tRNA synthetase